ncbi:hypothetical protein Dimus_014764 [Dionaea muscipula]
MYTSSTISFRRRSSSCFSFNECSYYSNGGGGCPLCCCTCCSSYPIHTRRVAPISINPSLLYGWRQSSLIQWSSSRTLILGGGIRYCFRSPIYEVGCRSNGGLCCCKGGNGYEGIRRKVDKGRYKCMVFKEGCEMRRDSSVEKVEAILSLLIEDVGEESLGVRERKQGSAKQGKVVKRVEVVDEGYKGKKGNVVVSGHLEGDSNCRLESSHMQSLEKVHRRGEKEALLKGEDRRSRSGGSSLSYYSCSGSGAFESDQEVDARGEEFVEEDLIHSGRYPRSTRIIGGREVEEESLEFGDERHQSHEDKQCDDNGKIWTSAAHGDFRKRSEMKLNEKSTEETAFRKGSISSQSKISGSRENTSAMASTSKSSLDCKGMATSSSGRKLSGNKENVVVSDDCRTRGHISGEVDLKSISQQRNELSETHLMNNRQTSIDDRRSQYRIRKHEDHSTMVETSTKVANERQYGTSYAAAGQFNSRRKSEDYGEVVAYSGENYVVNSSSSEHQSEIAMKDMEGASSLISRQELKGKQYQVGGSVDSKSRSGKISEVVRSASVVQSGKEETNTASQRVSEQRAPSEKSYITSKVKRVEQIIEKHGQIDDLINRSSFPKNFVPLEDSNKTSPKSPMTPPPSQLVERDPLYVEPVTVLVRQDPIPSRTSQAGSSSLSVDDPRSGSPSSRDEADGSARSKPHSEPPKFFSHEDALGSAERMENSSIKIVGEFVDQVRFEASTSQMQADKQSSETLSAHEDKEHVQRKSKKPEYGKSKVKKQDSRIPWSGGSRPKGPSGESQDVMVQTAVVPSDVEPSSASTAPGNAVPRKSGRSLWNIIGDVFLFRWGLHAETQKSTAKSSGQSLSNESASSEAWFSSNEPDEPHNGNVKRNKMSLPQEPNAADPALSKVTVTPMQSQRKDSAAGSLTETVSQVEKDASFSFGSPRITSGSGGISGETALECQIMKPGISGNTPVVSATQSGSAGISRKAVAVLETDVDLASTELTTSINLPLPLVAATTQTGSHGVEEILVEGRSGAVEGATTREQQLEHGTDLGLTPEESDGELYRRKFQRKDQIIRERFDEWEVSYRLETKQRKVDEIFMREALVEAKKAADSWEVPVGAVLVQNGKIIARGYNLVEELRDSTAHAEMICIREASKILRSWRLSETTLYVTLEPCPMCAGAMLQARINTVVWGAPNKLLGADGSWIRLLPEGGEGESHPESSDNKPPAPPVHPFHPNMKIRRGVLEPECADAMQQFFQLRRKKKRADPPPEQPSCLPVPHHPSKLFHKTPHLLHLLFCL